MTSGLFEAALGREAGHDGLAPVVRDWLDREA